MLAGWLGIWLGISWTWGPSLNSENDARCLQFSSGSRFLLLVWYRVFSLCVHFVHAHIRSSCVTWCSLHSHIDDCFTAPYATLLHLHFLLTLQYTNSYVYVQDTQPYPTATPFAMLVCSQSTVRSTTSEHWIRLLFYAQHPMIGLCIMFLCSSSCKNSSASELKRDTASFIIGVENFFLNIHFLGIRNHAEPLPWSITCVTLLLPTQQFRKFCFNVKKYKTLIAHKNKTIRINLLGYSSQNCTLKALAVRWQSMF